MLNINSGTITMLFLIILCLIVCPMIELITSSYKDSKIDCICIILCGFALTVTVSENNSILKYVDENGNEKNLNLNDNVKVHHEDSSNNKLLYTEKRYYNLLNKKIKSEITKVIIYERSELLGN